MNADELVTWLLQQKSEFVLQYLHEMVEGTRPLPEGFNWMGLAELAASDTFRNTFHKSEQYTPFNLGWANVAVFAYNYIIHEYKDGPRLAQKPDLKRLSYLSLELACMNVQAKCILQYGHLAGNPVLDVKNLVDCFFEDIPFSWRDVQNKYVDGKQEITMKDDRELLRIYRKTEVLRSLEKQTLLPRNDDLNHWFAVLDQVSIIWQEHQSRGA